MPGSAPARLRRAGRGPAPAILAAMDPHLLRTFVSVARRGSFTAAAHELGFTRSAVAEHIAALEADLRTTLLTREPVVAPTAAGVRLLEHAGAVLNRLDAARADIARLAGVRPAPLTLGASPLSLTPRIAAALANAVRPYPGTMTTAQVMARAAVPAAVATGRLRLGLTDGVAAPGTPLALPALPAPGPGAGPAAAAAGSDRRALAAGERSDAHQLLGVLVAETALVVALPTGHPLSRRLGLRLPDLAGARWLDAPDTAIPLQRLRALTGTRRFGASLAYHGTDVRGLLALAAAGHGLALLPHWVAEGAPGITALPLIAPRLVHRTELLYSGALEGPAAALVSLAARSGGGPPRDSGPAPGRLPPQRHPCGP